MYLGTYYLFRSKRKKIMSSKLGFNINAKILFSRRKEIIMYKNKWIIQTSLFFTREFSCYLEDLRDWIHFGYSL